MTNMLTHRGTTRIRVNDNLSLATDENPARILITKNSNPDKYKYQPGDIFFAGSYAYDSTLKDDICVLNYSLREEEETPPDIIPVYKDDFAVLGTDYVYKLLRSNDCGLGERHTMERGEFLQQLSKLICSVRKNMSNPTPLSLCISHEIMREIMRETCDYDCTKNTPCIIFGLQAFPVHFTNKYEMRILADFNIKEKKELSLIYPPVKLW